MGYVFFSVSTMQLQDFPPKRCAAVRRGDERIGGKGTAVVEVSKCRIFVVVTWYSLRRIPNESWEIWRCRSSDFKVRYDDVWTIFWRASQISLSLSFSSSLSMYALYLVVTFTCMDSDISTSGDLVLLERVESSVDVLPRRCKRVFFFGSYHVDSHKYGVYSGVC